MPTEIGGESAGYIDCLEESAEEGSQPHLAGLNETQDDPTTDDKVRRESSADQCEPQSDSKITEAKM